MSLHRLNLKVEMKLVHVSLEELCDNNPAVVNTCIRAFIDKKMENIKMHERLIKGIVAVREGDYIVCKTTFCHLDEAIEYIRTHNGTFFIITEEGIAGVKSTFPFEGKLCLN